MMPPLPERDINQTFDWSYTPKQMIEYGTAAFARMQVPLAQSGLSTLTTMLR